ncbi:MAG TPA: hypothetical protein VM686_06150 [Polyangiaceae bacterium]|nr:hypothetical protein [Polyangiaceae bacterium]
MTASLCIPRARAAGLAGALRALWTLPTTVAGHAFARLAGCGRARRIGGSAAPAYLYHLPAGRLRGLGAIAIGHAIVVEPAFIAGREAWILAHELSHTRQHDWLGPLYLLVHGVFQLLSALASLIRPVPGFPAQHAYNPLERRLLCVPFDVLAAPEPPAGERAQDVLRAFGLADSPS